MGAAENRRCPADAHGARAGEWQPTMEMLGGRLWRPFEAWAGDLGTPAALGRHLATVLSKVPRFGAQYPGAPYSVAQHCCALSVVLAAEARTAAEAEQLQAWALAHEAYEAYTGVDLPSPLKASFPKYAAGEDHFLALVAKLLRLPWPAPDVLRELDERLGAAEGRVLIPACDWTFQWPIEPLAAVPFLSPPAPAAGGAATFDGRWERIDAETAFLNRWQTLVLARLA